MTNPMFGNAAERQDLKSGFMFLVWDMAKGEVVTTGVIVRAMHMGTDQSHAEVTYVDSAGEVSSFNMVKFGVTCGPDQGWSHLITVPAEYDKRREELPVIPRP